MNDLRGALYFYDDEPHIFGFLKIGKDEWELVGVKRSKTRTDFTGRKKEQPEIQTDMFDERSGDSGQ